MTQNRFNYVKANFSQFEGKQVEFKYYIPSADKYATAKGILRKVGTGCNENCFIIGERGKDHAIYFENVTIIDDPMTRPDFIAVMEAYVEKLNNERKELRKLATNDWDANHMYVKVGHEISAIENAIREMRRE